MKRGSTARSLATIIIMMVFGLAMVFFPMRSRAVGKDASGKKGLASKGSTSALSSTSASGDSPSPAIAAPPPSAAAIASASAAPPSLPTGKGLPLVVGVAVFFLDVFAFDDTKGEFDCTTDVRYRWSDLRVSVTPAEAFRGFREWRGKDAEAQLSTMWTPNIEVTNRLEGGPSYIGRRLRIFTDGRVELITRQSAKYKVKVDAERFPFDRQYLLLDLLVREETTDEVVLAFDKDDVEWSRAAGTAKLDGWKLGLVDLDGDIVAGWNGDRYGRITASLFVDRLASTGLAPIFIPLVASLLIPLLAVWMNRATEEGFEIEAFELASMGIGGLFSVIALSFAIYTSYGMIAGGDNTVTRLFGLNYATLAMSLTIVVVFFRFNLVLRWFGRYVHEEVFRWISWAMPVLTLGTSVAFLMVAAA